MEARFIRTLVLFFVLTLVFGILEHCFPSVPNQPRLRRGLGTDILYWFFTPMVSQVLTMIAAAIALLPLYVVLGRSLEINNILAGYGLVAQLPLWQQGLIVIVMGDFMGYWTHRLNHTNSVLWNIHAVHHSAEIVDWLSAVRVHPLNDVISKGIKAIPIMLLGFSPLAVELYTPILSAYIAFVHANVPWAYGPFRYVIASPAFHRWHHEMDKKAWGKNYAGLFPIYDVIFGTFYVPSKQPKEFGIYGERMTENFMGQMLYPFRNVKSFRTTLNLRQKFLKRELGE
jgi:sterol desaturase/sphingolipid hydroxylase (fatty acid hydroxylase superfamily)